MPLRFNQNNNSNAYAQPANRYGSNRGVFPNMGNRQSQQSIYPNGLLDQTYRNRQNQPPTMQPGRQMQSRGMQSNRQMMPSAMPANQYMQAPAMSPNRYMQPAAMPGSQYMQPSAMPGNQDMQPSTMTPRQYMPSSAMSTNQSSFPPLQPGRSWSNSAAPPNQLSKPLPDGVRYEPLDANTMNLVKNLKLSPVQTGNSGAADITKPSEPLPLQQSQQQPLESTLHQEQPTQELIPHDDILQKIERFIQNERNASVFYQHLSTASQREDYSRVIDDIRLESVNHNRIYNNLHQKMKGEIFLPKENEIDTGVNFHDGINWAIAEECKTIKELSALYEQLEDEKDCRSISSVIYQKISNLSMLQLINTNKQIYLDGFQ